MRTTKEYVMRKHFNENGDTVYLETENDLIRCKDCKFWYMDLYAKCMASKSTPCTDENDFCSWAERKEE